MTEKKKKVTWVEPDEADESKDDDTQQSAVEQIPPKDLTAWTPPFLYDKEVPEQVENVPVSDSLPIYEPPIEEKEEFVRPTIAEVALPVGPKKIDVSMVDKILRVMVKNETTRTWYANMCFPGAYWQSFGERVDGPSTKAQHLAYDVEPGGIVSFGVVVPRLPEERPHELVVAVLENGIAWHEVMRIPFR